MKKIILFTFLAAIFSSIATTPSYAEDGICDDGYDMSYVCYDVASSGDGTYNRICYITCTPQ